MSNNEKNNVELFNTELKTHLKKHISESEDYGFLVLFSQTNSILKLWLQIDWNPLVAKEEVSCFLLILALQNSIVGEKLNRCLIDITLMFDFPFPSWSL